jgi:hypothetical protein
MPVPIARDVLAGVAGFLVLGACAALGDVPLRVAAVAGACAAGAVALTTPTLVITHAFLGLEGPVETVASAPLDAFVRTGRFALWLAPVLLFFVAAGNADVVYGFAVLGIGALGLTVGMRALVDGAGLKAVPIALGWAGLAGAVALHLAWRLVLPVLD